MLSNGRIRVFKTCCIGSIPVILVTAFVKKLYQLFKKFCVILKKVYFFLKDFFKLISLELSFFFTRFYREHFYKLDSFFYRMYRVFKLFISLRNSITNFANQRSNFFYRIYIRNLRFLVNAFNLVSNFFKNLNIFFFDFIKYFTIFSNKYYNILYLSFNVLSVIILIIIIFFML